MAPGEKLYLLDGSGYIYRAYHAIRPLSTSTGVPTHAVLGFARMLGKLLKEEQPHYLGVAFDGPEKTFRHQLYPQYKATRDAPPEDLLPQIPLVHELVDAMDIPVLRVPGFEADDLIATLARRAAAQGLDVVIVSGDKDLLQLVSDHVHMFDPMHDKRYDRAAVIERFGVPPEQVVEVQALAGDASDNIPGVPKVGPKMAAKLVSEYGDVEKVIAALATRDHRKAYEEAVVQHADNARLSRKLAELTTDAPVELDLARLRYSGPRTDKLAPLLRRIEAYALLRDLGLKGETETPASAPPPVAAEKAAAPAIDRSPYRTVLDRAELDAILAAAAATRRVSLDLETTSLDATRADIVGVALCVPGHPAAYVPVAHRYLGAPRQLSRELVLARLRPLCESPQVIKVGQNLKYDSVVLARAGVLLQGIGEDAMLAAWILDPAKLSYSLDTLAREVLGHENIRYSDVTGTGKQQIGFDEVPLDRATEYAAEDADVALKLCDVLGDRVRAQGLGALYHELEIPLVPVLAQMERTGVRVDVRHLNSLAKEFEARLGEIEARARRMIGDDTVNLASPKQLAEVFFDKLNYPVVKKTKTGYSTDQEVLETLARHYELPAVVLEHRLLAKLKSTYVDALPRMVNPATNRVHTSFNQTGTATGRLSSSDPNLQNIPIRSEDGRRIRAAFVSEPGWQIVAADYSQIELRIMAHLSADPAFVAAFQSGEDIHARTAREIITGGAEPNAETRRQAKAINFGILYGLSEFGLARQLGISRAEAHAFISAYFARHTQIRQFLDATIDKARELGYVSTLAGRRRFLPDLNSRNRNVRQAAERVAMNTPIQGSAADLIKLAMLRVTRALAEGKLQARLILQVHDELVFEAPADEIQALIDLTRREMTGVFALKVPLLVDVGHGPSWADAH